jgi:hypothetical protein
MRTPEQKLATKLRKAAEREAHREKVFKSILLRSAMPRPSSKKVKSAKSKINNVLLLSLAYNNNLTQRLSYGALRGLINLLIFCSTQNSATICTEPISYRRGD